MTLWRCLISLELLESKNIYVHFIELKKQTSPKFGKRNGYLELDEIETKNLTPISAGILLLENGAPASKLTGKACKSTGWYRKCRTPLQVHEAMCTSRSLHVPSSSCDLLFVQKGYLSS